MASEPVTLEQIRGIRKNLPAMTRAAIAKARVDGATWQEVADRLGVKTIRGARLLAGEAKQYREVKP